MEFHQHPERIVVLMYGTQTPLPGFKHWVSSDSHRNLQVIDATSDEYVQQSSWKFGVSVGNTEEGHYLLTGHLELCMVLVVLENYSVHAAGVQINLQFRKMLDWYTFIKEIPIIF